MRRHPFLAFVSALALLVASCGVDDSPSSDGNGNGGTTTTSPTTIAEPPEDPDQFVMDAGEATLMAESFSVESEANLEVAGQQLQLGSSGSVDYAGLLADVDIFVDQQGDLNEVGIRSDGTTLWVRAEGSGAPEFPDGRTWVEGDTSRIEEGETFGPAGLIGVLLAMRGAEGTEVSDGEELDGVDTRQYAFTITYAEATEAAGDMAEEFGTSLSLTGADDADLNIDVWIGDDGLVRRFELVIDAGGTMISGDYVVELIDVNQEIDTPDAPDEDEVLTGPEAEGILDQLLG
ncbi:hypothetical protein BH23ACT2_BH23ACT2_04470 [soil metagenome]